MKEIQTVVQDVYALLNSKDGSWFDDKLAHTLSDDIAGRLRGQLGEGSTQRATLRLSKMGPQCPRALWYSIHHPEMGEALPPWAKVKYSFGHILEALVIALVRASGHTVEGEQDAIVLDGIVGHRDCVIDGCIVDVKSASSRSFLKFKGKGLETNDTFGYLDQLDGYVVGSNLDPLVTVKDKGYILAIDKTLGRMLLYEHTVREASIRDRISYYKQVVDLKHPPACECKTIRHGAAGNLRLDIKASYSAFKYCCHPLLRTFVYSGGPVYLTKVVRTPDVPEIFRRIEKEEDTQQVRT